MNNLTELKKYIKTYVNEEFIRHSGLTLDMVMEAIDAYEGGAT